MNTENRPKDTTELDLMRKLEDEEGRREKADSMLQELGVLKKYLLDRKKTLGDAILTKTFEEFRMEDKEKDESRHEMMNLDMPALNIDKLPISEILESIDPVMKELRNTIAAIKGGVIRVGIEKKTNPNSNFVP